MNDNRLILLMDKAQRQPLTMIIPGNEIQAPDIGTFISDVTEDKDNENVKIMSWDDVPFTDKNTPSALKTTPKYILLSGLLQDYVIPQGMDYRLVKTFDQSTYFYMFGEQPPIVQMTISFSDGTLYLWNGEKMDTQPIDSYQAIDILEMINKKYFIYGSKGMEAKTLEPIQISFTFNRFFLRGYVVSIRAGGSSVRPGIADAGFTVVVKDYTTMPVIPWPIHSESLPDSLPAPMSNNIPLNETFQNKKPPSNSTNLDVINKNYVSFEEFTQ